MVSYTIQDFGDNTFGTFSNQGELKSFCSIKEDNGKIYLLFLVGQGHIDSTRQLIKFVISKSKNGILYVKEDAIIIIPMQLLNELKENQLIKYC